MFLSLFQVVILSLILLSILLKNRLKILSISRLEIAILLDFTPFKAPAPHTQYTVQGRFRQNEMDSRSLM